MGIAKENLSRNINNTSGRFQGARMEELWGEADKILVAPFETFLTEL
jgi:hypothetical protein